MNFKKIEELKNLFDKFSTNTLESINLLLSYTKHNLEEANIAYLSVYNQKYEELRDEFQGINDYDYISEIGNFDLSEIKKNVDVLDEKELLYLKSLIENAINNMVKN